MIGISNLHPRTVAAAVLGGAVLGATVTALLAAGPAAATPATTAGSAALHAVHVDGVTLRVPASWHVHDTAALPGCIVDPAAAKVSPGQAAYGANNCQLQVLAGRTLPLGAGPDSLYFPGDPAQCLRGSVAVDRRTVAAKGARVGGVAAEYRRFALPCLEHPSEQWFVARQPGVLIQRTRMSASTEAAARRAVTGATLPAGHGLPRAVVGTPRRAGKAAVLLGRTRLSYDAHGSASATPAGGRGRSFAVPASIRIPFTDRHGNTVALSRGEFLHDVRHGFPRSGTLQPEVTVTSAVGSSHPSAVSVTLASTR